MNNTVQTHSPDMEPQRIERAVEYLGGVATARNVLVVNFNDDEIKELELLERHGLLQGVPPQVEVLVPNVPHIFNADVTIADKNGTTHMGTMKTLMAHGFTQNTGKWTFADGRNVEEVVNAYNRGATEKNIPKISFVAVCRNNPSDRDATIDLSGFEGDVLHVRGSDLALQTHIDPATKTPIMFASPTTNQGRFMTASRNAGEQK